MCDLSLLCSCLFIPSDIYILRYIHSSCQSYHYIYVIEHTLEEGRQYVAMYNSAFLCVEDVMEAMSGFMSKTPPKFQSSL